MIKILDFLELKRIEGRDRYLLGDCYKLAIYLQSIYGGEVGCQYHVYDKDNVIMDHCVLILNDRCYDIDGENYFSAKSMTNDEIKTAEGWHYGREEI